MRPIVDGLHETYSEDMAFVYLNALDHGAGQAAFESLGLLGHPAFVLFGSDGRESFRALGIVTERQLIAAVRDLLDDTSPADSG